MKLPRESIYSHTEKFPNTVTDTREGCAKYLLLPL
jgi:hypothetical protein